MEQLKLWKDEIVYCERCGRPLYNIKSKERHKGYICDLRDYYKEIIKEDE